MLNISIQFLNKTKTNINIFLQKISWCRVSLKNHQFIYIVATILFKVQKFHLILINCCFLPLTIFYLYPFLSMSCNYVSSFITLGTILKNRCVEYPESIIIVFWLKIYIGWKETWSRRKKNIERSSFLYKKGN